MKKSVSVSNLTLDMWLDCVRPALKAADMLEKVPARDDWHEYTAEVIDETTAEEIAHCMTVACFNAHQAGKYSVADEAAQMLYQLDVSIEYAHARNVNADKIKAVRDAIANYINHTATDNEQNDEQNEEENEMDNTGIIETMRADIIAHTERSAWSKGVTEYALELLDSLAEGIECGYFYADDIAAPRVLEKNLLNGAADWSAYSWGGCSLIYDSDIAERLCTPSELKKTRNGERKPSAREEWLDCQARALYQAARRVMSAARRATEAA